MDQKEWSSMSSAWVLDPVKSNGITNTGKGSFDHHLRLFSADESQVLHVDQHLDDGLKVAKALNEDWVGNFKFHHRKRHSSTTIGKQSESR